MIFKKGVKINSVKPELSLGLLAADGVYKAFEKELVITAITDGTHSRGSLHYVGYAADLRTNYFTQEQISSVSDMLRSALTDEFDVVVESTHIHLEFQPKD